jgi:hypothetical protein
MAKAKEEIKDLPVAPVKVKRYGKQTFVNAPEYEATSELLSALLEDGTKYSRDEVNSILDKYLNKEAN